MSRKITTEEFIRRAIEKHGDKYNYDKTMYIDSHTHIIITCKTHLGYDFKQTPSHHLRGQGCPKCGLLQRVKSRTTTRDEFIDKSNRIHNYKYNYDNVEYVNDRTQVIIKCTFHNDFFSQIAGDHLQGAGCPKCGIMKVSMTRKKTTEQFIDKAIKIYGNLYNYEKVNYISNIRNVIIICNIHGEFSIAPVGHLFNMNGCPKCGIKLRSLKHTKTTEQFINEANKIHNYIYNYDETIYKGCKYQVVIKCNIHGNFSQLATNHLKSMGCPYCVNKTEAKLKHFLICIYPNIMSQFKQKWCKNNFTNRFLPFDFCIPEYKTIIEVDGEQHFRQVSTWTHPRITQARDRFKMKSAIQNGYSIIRIKQEDIWEDRLDWVQAIQDTISLINTCRKPDVYTITEIGDTSYNWMYQNTEALCDLDWKDDNSQEDNE